MEKVRGHTKMATSQDSASVLGLTEDILMQRSSLEVKKRELSSMECDQDELLEMCSNELENKNQTIQRLQNENAILKATNLSLRSKHGNRIPVIFAGKETDKFPDEIKDLILSELDQRASDLQAMHINKGGSHIRRLDVFTDIVSNNNYEGLIKKRRNKLQKGLKGVRTPKEYSKMLEELGFVHELGKGHPKWLYFGDERYRVKSASTGGDGARGGYNSFSDFDHVVY